MVDLPQICSNVWCIIPCTSPLRHEQVVGLEISLNPTWENPLISTIGCFFGGEALDFRQIQKKPLQGRERAL